MSAPLLEVRGLVTRFPTRRGTVHAVNGVSWSLGAGEALGIVGESGSGKSVAALSILGLVPPPGEVVAGEVRLGGRDLLALGPRELRDVRGREVAMVFQDPLTSLNPVLTVGRQIGETLERHLGMRSADAEREAAELLRLVGIPDPESRLHDHPHRFSGGQRQRIVLAIALACRPSVLIADEPTTALDVTIQAQIVALVQELRRRLGMAIVWITHDLALAAGLVDRVVVMYAGTVVEEAPVRTLFRAPRHPYTVGLLRSLPSLETAPGEPLAVIPGRPPDLFSPPRACPFAPRCPWAEPACGEAVPPLRRVGEGHSVACRRWEEVGLDRQPPSGGGLS